MELSCPSCKKEIDVSGDLPEHACDSTEYDCDCGCTFEYGWYATAEVRNVIAKGLNHERH